MRIFKADLHVHTILSPCGSLEMSPQAIVRQAKQKKIDILGITDHNSTRQVETVKALGAKAGVQVFFGVEINSAEEIHCLAFFETHVLCNKFQHFLDKHLGNIANNPDIMGDQVVVNLQEEIIYEEKRLLIAALDADIETIEKEVHALNGIFIPAHIDRASNSLISQLGFLPENLQIDGVEISPSTDTPLFLEKHQWIKGYPVVRGSDAHVPDNIGKAYTICEMEHATFSEFRLALKNLEGRKIQSI